MQTVPSARARFRPRADAKDLRALIAAAQAAFAEELNAEVEAADLSGVVTQWLLARYPQADMEVLARYGFAKTREKVEVTAGGQYFGVPLTTPVIVPERAGPFTACGRRFSEEPGYGLNPEYLAELTASGGLDAYLADHREREGQYLPRVVDPLFTKISEARAAFEQMTAHAYFWPDRQRREAGQYPTWSEIGEAFPVLGAHLQALWSAAPMARAA